jgi:aspartyl-tRNA(Asn)/glutamyl-tRNA(Gln) amidotransferase subunit A
MAAFIEEGLAITTDELAEALAHQAAFQAAVHRALAEVDALVVPATPAPAPADLSTTGDPRFNSPWSHAGVPTVSIPCALTRGGLPVALQVVGRAWHDRRIAQVARWCEDQLAFQAPASLFAE